jgi:hypothetical protein
MISTSISIYTNWDNRSNGIVISATDQSDKEHIFFSGDTYQIKLYLRENYTGDSSSPILLDNNVNLLLGIKNQDTTIRDDLYAYIDKWDLQYDTGGQPYYSGLLQLATEELESDVETNGTQDVDLEIVVSDKNTGGQYSLQGVGSIRRTIIPSVLVDAPKPTIGVGTYGSVVSICTGIIDQRILDLKAGAPLEFDTLFELAHYAQKVRSHEIVTGDFCDYLDGKKLVDQNLTVVSLGQIMIDSSTYKVSHEPWRPKEVTASIIE